MPDSDPTPEDTMPDGRPARRDDDPRSDIEQAVAARSDALKRGEGGPEAAMMTDPGEHSGNRGTGGEVRNQDLDAQ